MAQNVPSPNTSGAVVIREATTDEDVGVARALIAEYADSLGVDLDFQDFSRELASLPGDYVRPRGVLLLASIGGRDVGCVGVRPLETDGCEMKRLYVRTSARGTGTGRRLADAAIAFAREAGYRTMRLDTLPGMDSAQHLYRTLGFREVAPYRYNPVPGTTFMELALVNRSET
jgi:ribosomal protein S18 acetylase RimI-like enzyme